MTPLEQSKEAQDEALSIEEVVDGIGFGYGQIAAIIVACGTFFAEGLELLLISMISESIFKDVGVGSQLQAGFLISAIVFGAFLGNIISGPFADLAGRQHPITTGYSLVVLFSVWSSFMNSFVSICVFRFFVGLGFGLGQPAAIALVNEVVPRAWRFTGTCCSSLLFGLGAFLAVIFVMLNHAWLDDITVTEWRLLLRCAAVPVGLLGLAAIFLLPESPSFLAASNDFALARDVLAHLRRQNGGRVRKHEAFRTSDAKYDDKKAQLFSPFVSTFERLFAVEVIPQTVLVCVTTLVLNFALYGSGYVVPHVLSEVLPMQPVHGMSLAPTVVLLLALTSAGLLLVCCMVWGTCVGPKAGILGCLAISLLSAFLFCWTSDITGPSSLFQRVLLIPTCFGLCCGPTFGILFLVQISFNLYPTLASATGVAVCLALGRIGACTAPLVAGAMQDASGAWQSFFVVMGLLELGCLLILTLLDVSPVIPGAADQEQAAEVGDA